MKLQFTTVQTKLLLIFILFFSLTGVSQSNIGQYNFTFEDTTHNYFMYRDTIANPNCIWQIGAPQKTVFNSAIANSLPNAIVTDTVNTYPINDTSSFIIKHEVGQGYLYINDFYPIVKLMGYYFVDSDTLNDFGKIEFSPDNGLSWILISDDTLTLQNSGASWPYIEYNPVFTGNSNGWRYFSLTLSGYDYSSFSIGDTVQYKFTFISDATNENKDGLMFDNITVRDDIGGSINNLNQGEQFCYPNPFQNQLTFKVKNEYTGITIYDINGKIVYTSQFQNQSQIEIQTSAFKKGVYFYVFSTKKGDYTERGKIVKV